MTCVVCKIGDLQKGKTTVTLRRNLTVMVIEEVDAHICDQCGHYYLDSETAQMTMDKLNGAVLRGSRLEIAGSVAA